MARGGDQAARRRRSTVESNRLGRGIGLLVTALGMLQIIGLLTGMPGLIARTPGGQATGNPAWGVLALGITIFLLSIGRRIPALIAAGIVVGAGAAGFAGVVDPAGGCSLAAVAAGFAATLLVIGSTRASARAATAVAAALPLMVGVASLWLHVVDQNPGGWARMFVVPHLAVIACLLGGAGLLSLTWARERLVTGHPPPWRPLALVLSGIALTLILAVSISTYESVLLERQVGAHAHALHNQVESSLGALVRGVERMEARWSRGPSPDPDRWRSETQALLGQAKAMRAVVWIDSDGITAAAGPSLESLGISLEALAPSLATADERDASLVTPVISQNGEPLMAVVAPLSRPSSDPAWLVGVFSPGALFAQTMEQSTSAGMATQLDLPQGPSLRNSVPVVEFLPGHEDEALIAGSLIGIVVRPGPGLHLAAGGVLSAAGFLLGVVASLLLGAVVYLNGVARKKAMGMTRAIQALKREAADRKRAESELRMSEARFRAVFDHAAIALVRIDPRVRILEANRAAERMLGYPKGDLAGRDARDFSPIEDIARERRPFRDLLEGKRASYQLEKRYRRRDGTTMWGRVTASLVRDDEGGHPFVIAMIEDISARKSAEARQLETMQRLQESNSELERFASVVAHDLQEPLLTIRMFGLYLEEEAATGLDEEGRDFLGRIRCAADHMQSLIEALLALSRVTSRGRAFEEVDLNGVIESVRTDLRGRFEETGGVLEVAPLPPVQGDPAQLRQLFQNLLGNALKYRRPDVAPAIRVWSERRDGGHRFYVADNGTGFDPKDRPRLFQPFERLHDPKEYAGTGIGLPICKRIVEHHGGEIDAEGEPGGGATFSFTLPAARSRPRPGGRTNGGPPATRGPPEASSR